MISDIFESSIKPRNYLLNSEVSQLLNIGENIGNAKHEAFSKTANEISLVIEQSEKNFAEACQLFSPLINELKQVDYFYWLDMPVWTIRDASFLLCGLPPSYDDEMYCNMPAEVAKMFTLLNRYAMAGMLKNNMINETTKNQFASRPINYIRLIKDLDYLLPFILKIFANDPDEYNHREIIENTKNTSIILDNGAQRNLIRGYKMIENSSKAGKLSGESRRIKKEEKIKIARKIAMNLLKSPSGPKNMKHLVETIIARINTTGETSYSKSILTEEFNKDSEILILLRQKKGK
jgi:hypothetical protein